MLSRISDDKLLSIPQQVKECVRYAWGDAVGGVRRGDADAVGGVVDRVYNLGEHSGFKIDQSPVMRQILQEAERGEFDALVCRDGARLGRDYWEKMGTIRDLRRAKVELHIIEDGGFFDYEDSMNKVRSFANTWGDEGKKLEEIRKSMRATQAIRDARFPTTSLPFGYEPGVDAVSRRKVWRPTPEAEIVKSVFRSIREEPYEEFSSLSRRHGISRQLLRKILRNRAYTGGFNWKGQFVRCEPHVIPPLVDEASFEEVQRILSRREMTARIRSPDLMNVILGFSQS
ncbi:MAG TPA: recombinase family protein [Candidatus Thermoplasmatota archaeon]|nr:recombinase family protein [Candidatus Thermoplasmatota archaeon]